MAEQTFNFKEFLKSFVEKAAVLENMNLSNGISIDEYVARIFNNEEILDKIVKLSGKTENEQAYHMAGDTRNLVEVLSEIPTTDNPKLANIQTAFKRTMAFMATVYARLIEEYSNLYFDEGDDVIVVADELKNKISEVLTPVTDTIDGVWDLSILNKEIGPRYFSCNVMRSLILGYKHFIEELDSKETKDVDNAESEKELRDLVSRYFDNNIVKKALNRIKDTYSLLFESGYGLEAPAGLLLQAPTGKFGLLTIEKEEGVVKSVDFSYDVLGGQLINNPKFGFKTSQSRDFLVSGDTNYFPYRLAEYAFGRARCTKEELEANPLLYKRHSSIGRWAGKDGYLERRIVPDTTQFITNALVTITKSQLESNNLTADQMFDMSNTNNVALQELNARAEAFINTLVDSMCRCILITEDSAAQLQIRVCAGRATLDETVLNSIIEGIARFKAVEQRDDGSYDISFRDMKNKGMVYELSIVLNSKLLGAVPLFAYKAAEVLKQQGKEVNWNSIILGKDEDRNILTANSEGSPIMFPAGTSHAIHISAGSGSGKGVMTLNILGSALANNIPVVYLDAKPDMAYMLQNLMGNTPGFIYNGGSISTVALSQADALKAMQMYGPEGARSNWKKYIPNELLTKFGSDFSKWTALGYLKALDLSVFIMATIGAGEQLLQRYCNVAASDNKIVVVADELQNLQSSLSGLLSAVVKEYKAVENKLLKNAKKATDKQEEVTASDMAILALGKWAGPQGWYASWKEASTRDFRDAVPSVLFTIYQTFDPGSNSYITSAGTPFEFSDAEGAAQLFGNSALFRGITRYIGNTALLGFDAKNANTFYKSNKAKKYLTKSNRYFAMTPNIETVADESDAVFFKPFLILNKVEPTPDGGKNVSDMLGVCAKNDIPEVVIREQHTNPDGTWKQELGFEGYMKMLGNTDYVSTLNRAYQIAYNILERIGYFKANPTATLADFFMDFRAEWMFSRWEDLRAAIVAGQVSTSNSALEGLNEGDFGDLSDLGDFGESDEELFENPATPVMPESVDFEPDVLESIESEPVAPDFVPVDFERKNDGLDSAREAQARARYEQQQELERLRELAGNSTTSAPARGDELADKLKNISGLSGDAQEQAIREISEQILAGDWTVHRNMPQVSFEEAEKAGTVTAHDTSEIFTRGKNGERIFDSSKVPADNKRVLTDGNYVNFPHPVLPNSFFEGNNIRKLEKGKTNAWKDFVKRLFTHMSGRNSITTLTITENEIIVNGKLVEHGFFENTYITSLSQIADLRYLLEQLTNLAVLSLTQDMLNTLFIQTEDQYENPETKKTNRTFEEYIFLSLCPKLNKFIILDSKRSLTRVQFIEARKNKKRQSSALYKRMKQVSDAKQNIGKMKKHFIKNSGGKYHLSDTQSRYKASQPKYKGWIFGKALYKMLDKIAPDE